MISHKYPFLILSCFPQTWFGNKNTSSALWTPYSFTTTMPQRSRKLLFLYCADPRGNKYVVQSHPAKLCWGTLTLSTSTIFLVNFPSDEKLLKTQSVPSHVPAEFPAQQSSVPAGLQTTMTVLHRSSAALPWEDAGHRRLLGEPRLSSILWQRQEVLPCSRVRALWHSRGTRKYEFLLKRSEYLLADLKPGHIFPEMQKETAPAGILLRLQLPHSRDTPAHTFSCVSPNSTDQSPSSDQTCTAERQTPPAW